MQKIPYIAIIGDKELKPELAISVRARDGKNVGKLKVDRFLDLLKEEIETKK